MGTADGINDKDWEHLKDLAARLCDTIGSEQEQESRREFWACLDEMEDKYGPLPSLLATRGDFSEDYEEKEDLLRRAYAAALAIGDRKNSLDIAHSLTELYMDELVSVEDARTWLDRLDTHLLEIHDSTYAEDAQKFRKQLKKLGSLGNP
jgi:hypothetical protein